MATGPKRTKRAITQPPRIPRLEPTHKPPQLNSVERVKKAPKIKQGDLPLGERRKYERNFPYESSYMKMLHKDPSRQRREDFSQRENIEKLEEEKRAIDDEISSIRNEKTRVNPYNMSQSVASVLQSIIADLRNMEQTPRSGNLSGYYDYSPLHKLFKNQFSVSEEDEDAFLFDE